jgi:hypothetical protein
MSLRDINEKYLEVLVNSHEFFTGIFLEKEDGMQLGGVIKGRIDYENSEEAWISSILVDNPVSEDWNMGPRLLKH